MSLWGYLVGFCSKSAGAVNNKLINGLLRNINTHTHLRRSRSSLSP